MADRILLVEDEPSIADSVCYALEAEGFAPVWAATGAAALEALATTPAVLTILDIGLPDINGLELCKRLHKTSDLPVIFLTARADEVDRIVGLEIGADDYMTKPFSPRELAARVKAVLRRGQRRPTTSQRTFAVDESRRSVSYHGKMLELSRQEYEILKILAAHPGRVYSRSQLMNAAWEEPLASMERTVDSHIKALRAKLKLIHPDEEAILTRRGFGYCLAEGL